MSPKQVGSGEAKRRRQALQHENCGIASAALKVAGIGPVNSGTVGKFLLTPPAIHALAADVCPEALPNVHARTGMGRRLSVYRR